VRTGLQFAEQPRVLDRDNGLVGKGADQFDLPLAEWLDPLPRQREDPDRFALTQQRHTQCGSRFPDLGRFWQCVFRIGRDISYVADSAFQRGPLRNARSTGLK